MLPNDPNILLSFVNMKLRDEYETLSELCASLDEEEADLTRRLADAGDAAAARKGVAVGFMFPEQRDAAVALARRLRESGECVDLSLHSAKPKQFFARAGAGACAKAVFIGPDDVAAGKAKMKDLETREQTDIPLGGGAL